MQIRSASEKHGGESRGYSADLPEKVRTRLYAGLNPCYVVLPGTARINHPS